MLLASMAVGLQVAFQFFQVLELEKFPWFGEFSSMAFGLAVLLD
jgi:hypothetical protein